MNTLNYIGCKNTLYKTLLSVIKDNIINTNDKTFLDLFAGTGIVGFNMMFHFKKCDANDLEFYSYVINYALLKCYYSENLKNIIDECNHLPLIEGLIYDNFSPNELCERMFFTNSNAMKADAIRQYIETKYNNNSISLSEYYFLLASLVVSIDKVANTSCVYGAYLKEYKKTALKDVILQPIHTNIDNVGYTLNHNSVYNVFAETFSETYANYYDVIYIDPPYNQRQYSANYSPLNYIAQYDNTIVLKGKTGLIENYNKSSFCKKREVKDAFSKLIYGLKCNYLIISYNNEGLLSRDEFEKIVTKKGYVKLYKIKYGKFKAQEKVDKSFVEEYIWVIDTTRIGTAIEEIDIDVVK
uniref:site-specific DNA-methyltransferase (adenine-specific) n=1 Tax=viral metagenome TaxID=1070528 RepID=A0A6C0ESN7_9ZZZZ